MVGPDGQTSLQAQIAARLLKDCDKDPAAVVLPAFGELNAAVSLLKDGVKHPSDLYDYVHSAIRKVTRATDFATPEPIRQLAQIADFRLMVTLTPDDLLARALRRRCAVYEVIHSPENDVKDLPGIGTSGPRRSIFSISSASQAPFRSRLQFTTRTCWSTPTI